MRRQGGAGRDDFGEAGHGAEQGDQRRGAGHDDADAPIGEERDVAGELDGVAEALLGHHQEGLPGDVVAAPLGAGDGGEVGGEHRVPPAPFVVGEARGVVAGEEVGGAAVPVGAGEIGAQRDGGGAGGDGVRGVSLGGEDEAEAGRGLGDGGVGCHGGANFALAAGEVVEIDQGIAQGQARLGMGGGEVDGAFEGGAGVSEALKRAFGGAAGEPSLGIVGRRHADAHRGVQRVDGAAVAQQSEGEAGAREGGGGVDGDRGAVGADRLDGAAGGEEAGAEGDVGLDQARSGGQRETAFGDGAGGVAGIAQGVGEVDAGGVVAGPGGEDGAVLGDGRHRGAIGGEGVGEGGS